VADSSIISTLYNAYTSIRGERGKERCDKVRERGILLVYLNIRSSRHLKMRLNCWLLQGEGRGTRRLGKGKENEE
jgi:hypothetical protein